MVLWSSSRSFSCLILSINCNITIRKFRRRNLWLPARENLLLAAKRSCCCLPCRACILIWSIGLKTVSICWMKLFIISPILTLAYCLRKVREVGTAKEVDLGDWSFWSCKLSSMILAFWSVSTFNDNRIGTTGRAN